MMMVDEYLNDMGRREQAHRSDLNRMGESTRAVHGGANRNKGYHSLTEPIVQTATFTFRNTQDVIDYMEATLHGEGVEREEYGRYGNPTVNAVERKLAALDGGEDAVLFSSGMAAVTTTLLAILPTGAHIIMTDDCYRRTRQFALTFLKRFGIETAVVPMGDYESMEAAIIPKKTRVIVSESPTNPYLRVADLEKVAALGKAHKVLTLIDSTFATPINQRPLDWGIDLVTHSATKYLSGHNDLLAGVVVGRADRIKALRDARGILGSIMDPHAASLLDRGLKTLGVRMGQQNANALAVAQFLSHHPAIDRVWYPGLPEHPDHSIAALQMNGYGGVVTFEVKGDLKTTSDFIDRLRIPYIAPSLGGVESLIEQPALISYYDKSTEERLALGMKDNLVRFAVGIEDTDDLLDDLEQGLSGVPAYQAHLRGLSTLWEERFRS
ncbi:MAG TPA: aminotransferase class I/II-fold pyridoxal phosphate-dependent enzyme [Candidatus Limnocylindrales bacterium]|nr:aminotransferase class I/II-fold pyridoxal phosphate-dependent enzyme [Candidatus Limnocylindrales bacterium]